MTLIPQPRDRKGQGLVEFALVVPILMLLVIGALDLGLAFYVKIVLENSAREGAYYLVYHTETGKLNSFAEVKTAVQTEGQNSGIGITTAEIDVRCLNAGVQDDTCPSGSTAVVAVHHSMPLLVNIFFQGPLPLVNEARMQVP